MANEGHWFDSRCSAMLDGTFSVVSQEYCASPPSILRANSETWRWFPCEVADRPSHKVDGVASWHQGPSDSSRCSAYPIMIVLTVSTPMLFYDLHIQYFSTILFNYHRIHHFGSFASRTEKPSTEISKLEGNCIFLRQFPSPKQDFARNRIWIGRIDLMATRKSQFSNLTFQI
jgi:hypothetical protein